jgi:ankyrin repeat protein
MTGKKIQVNFDVCFILIILISGCTGGEDIEINQEVAVESEVSKQSTNMPALHVEVKENINYPNSKRKVHRQIEIVEIFKHNNINELMRVYDDGFDLITISSVRGKLGVTPLHVASRNGSNKILEYLGGFDVNFNMQDNGGGTLLHTAITGNQVDTVRLLLKLGADSNLKNKQGYTAMDMFLINKENLDKEIYSILTNSDAGISAESRR